MLPPRPPGNPGSGPKSGILSGGGIPSYEVLKNRVLAKLEDRMDPGTSKRMPPSLFRQSLRTFAEQIAEQDAKSLSKPDRERLIDEVLAELLGYGPLEELFNDPTVREVMVCGPHAVIVRREQGGWLPSHIRFRDDEHLNSALERLATHADTVGGVTTSVNAFDLKLPNGFRVMALVPPPALGVASTLGFVRVEAAQLPTPVPPLSSTNFPRPAMTPAPGSSTNLPRTAVPANPGSGIISTSSIYANRQAADPPTPRSGTYQPVATTPPPRTGPPADALTKHRNRVIERLISKMASLGVDDLHRLGAAEMRRVVTAYVAEYIVTERLALTDADQARLVSEILSAMQH